MKAPDRPTALDRLEFQQQAAVAAGILLPCAGRCARCQQNQRWLVWRRVSPRKTLTVLQAVCADQETCRRAIARAAAKAAEKAEKAAAKELARVAAAVGLPSAGP